MEYEIIDFHTHPFIERHNNICSHTDNCDMSADNTIEVMKELGISMMCGSVIDTSQENQLEKMLYNNNTALKLKEIYGDFYVPGFHVNPLFAEKSCEEIERMAKAGIHLIGELVPYMDGWNDYSCKEMDEILDVAEQYDMVVSFHSMNEDAMDKMVEKHTGITFVAAHPGEYREFCRHMERMKNPNYYLDLSGYGIFRYGMLRHAIDLFGAERFLYGSDFPTCSPAMYIGGIMGDTLISPSEKKLILAENAKRILRL